MLPDSVHEVILNRKLRHRLLLAKRLQYVEDQKSSDYYIQAVEKAEVLILTRNDADGWFINIPAFSSFRLMMQKAYSATLK